VNVRSEFALSNNRTLWSYFTPAQDVTITKLSMATGTIAAAGVSAARMGLYNFDTDDYYLVAQTASDTTLFTFTDTIFERSLNTAGGFPSSYNLIAGKRYAMGVCVSAGVMPRIIGAIALSGLAGLDPIFAGTRSTSGVLPTNISSAAVPANIFWGRLS
jgi:hypothetical protein